MDPPKRSSKVFETNMDFPTGLQWAGRRMAALPAAPKSQFRNLDYRPKNVSKGR
jgi:hypothetical protein